MDFDGDLSRTFANSNCRFLLISFSSDWRFPPERTREIVDALLEARKPVSYLEVEADQGHDAFLLPVPRYMEALTTYLQRVADEGNAQPANSTEVNS